MSYSLKDLTSYFGKNTPVAKKTIQELFATLSQDIAQFQTWKHQFLPTAPKKLKTEKIAHRYELAQHKSLEIIFTLQTYYAIVIKVLAAHRLAPPETGYAVENGTHFVQNGIQNFTEGDVYSWYLDQVNVDELHRIASQFRYDDPVPDALKALYHDLFPRTLRHTLGEYYTPDWLANFVLNRIQFNVNQRLLDPMCGSGTFVVLAYRRLLDAGVDNPLDKIAGIDVNPLACLSAKANLILNLRQWHDNTSLPIYCEDVLLNPPDIGEFDMIVGNPPWVNWETLPEDYRQQTKALWEHYNLFPHSGFDTILGKGKKDLSLLLTYAVVDRYLSRRGTLAFIMTQSVLKTGGAAEGFRRFDFANKEFSPNHVDDFSKLRIFSGAETKPIVLVLEGNQSERPSYYVWRAKKKTIPAHAPKNIIEKMSYSEFIAEPVAELGSAWLTGKSAALQAVRKLLGQSDYEAHAGVYTGGANAIYWLEICQREGNMLRVRNVIKGAKRRVPQVEAWIESDLVFPLLRGRDLSRWQAEPTLHILIVQNPETRRGYERDWLKSYYPHTYNYLAQFETILRKRATFKRYFKEDAPFYTMFDIGTYTFCPYKVVWHGFGKKRMEAVVVGSVNNKPIMTNQAMHPFIGLQDEDEAHYLAACLNSAPFEFAVISHTQTGGKSFAQPGILKNLRLPKFDVNNAAHLKLSRLSRQAHNGEIDDAAIAETSAELWNLTASELRELKDSLSELVD